MQVGLAEIACISKTLRKAYIVRFSFVLMENRRRWYGAVRTFLIAADRENGYNIVKLKSVSPMRGNLRYKSSIPSVFSH